MLIILVLAIFLSRWQMNKVGYCNTVYPKLQYSISDIRRGDDRVLRGILCVRRAARDRPHALPPQPVLGAAEYYKGEEKSAKIRL